MQRQSVAVAKNLRARAYRHLMQDPFFFLLNAAHDLCRVLSSDARWNAIRLRVAEGDDDDNDDG